MRITSRVSEILTTPYHFSAAWDGPVDRCPSPGMDSLPEPLRAATPKRITEFLAGRFCATKAIQAFRPDWSGQVGMDPDGSPCWPDGVVGSITHTQGFAAAAIAPSDRWLSIGIDSEKIADATVLREAKEIILTGEERRLGTPLPIPEDQFVLLVFCAKESIYKCLFPLSKRILEFSSVILDEIHFQQRRFHFHCTDSIELNVMKKGRTHGRFELTQDYIHTGVELRHPI